MDAPLSDAFFSEFANRASKQWGNRPRLLNKIFEKVGYLNPFFAGHGLEDNSQEMAGLFGLANGLFKKAFGIFSAINISERAFFSGAGTEAEAIAAGFKTLSQTRAGRNLNALTKSMEYYGPINGQAPSMAWKMWARLSSVYANGIPCGSTVHVYLNNPSPLGIWNLIEKPILEKKGINLIIHQVK